MERLIQFLQEGVSVYADIASLLSPKVIMVTGEGQVECFFLSDKKAENLEEGKLLKLLRKGYGYTQQEVGDFLKIDRVSINQIELGNRKMKLEEAKSLGEFFELGESNIFLMC